MTVWAVVLTDRHFDEVMTLHGTKDGADRRVVDIMAGYERIDRDEWSWNERSHTWRCGDDGPRIRIEHMEVQP